MRTKSAMLDRSRFSAITGAWVVDADRPLCQTRGRRSAIFFMAASLQPTVVVDTITGAATRGSIKIKAGGRDAADLVLQLPARGAGSVAFHSPFIGSTEHWLTPLHAGMK
jgi:hypothetical protein